jgi:hypothetical protein
MVLAKEHQYGVSPTTLNSLFSKSQSFHCDGHRLQVCYGQRYLPIKIITLTSSNGKFVWIPSGSWISNLLVVLSYPSRFGIHPSNKPLQLWSALFQNRRQDKIWTDNTNRNIKLCYLGSLKKASLQFIIPGINNFLVKVRASVHFQIPCQHLEILLIVVRHSWKRDHNKFKLNKVMQDKNKNNFFIIMRKSPSSTCKADILVIWIRATDFFERVHFTRHL